MGEDEGDEDEDEDEDEEEEEDKELSKHGRPHAPEQVCTMGVHAWHVMLSADRWQVLAQAAARLTLVAEVGQRDSACCWRRALAAGCSALLSCRTLGTASIVLMCVPMLSVSALTKLLAYAVIGVSPRMQSRCTRKQGTLAVVTAVEANMPQR